MAPRSSSPLADAMAAFLALVWFGMLLGVSFLATPAKFQAPSLDLTVALEVGRITFTTFSKVEWVLSLFLIVATILPRTPRAEIVLTAAAVLVVAVQTIWLLPVLDARVEAVISGEPLPPSMHHMIYAALEAAKAAALAAVAFVALFRLGWASCPNPLRISR